MCGKVVQYQKRLRAERGVDGVVGERLPGCGIVNGNGRAGWPDQIGEVARPFEVGGDGSVFVNRTRRVLAGKGEEDKILAAGLGQLGDEGLAGDGESVVVGVVAEVLLGLASDGEGLGIKSGWAAVPEDRAVRLAGLEVAEVAATTSATTPSASATRAAEAAAGSAEESSTSASALAGRLAERLELLLVFHPFAKVAHSGEGIGGSGLPGDRDGIAGEVGISCNRGQGGAGVASATPGLQEIGGGAGEGQTLSASSAAVLPS